MSDFGRRLLILAKISRDWPILAEIGRDFASKKTEFSDEIKVAERTRNISNSRRIFDVYVFILNSNSLTKHIFHVCVFVSVTRYILAKSTRYVYLIQIDGAQNCARMCMCIEFVIQVLKQKDAHVSFPVGMVMTLSQGAKDCHDSMSYRQDFRRNVAPCTAVLAQEHAFSETALPVL